MRRWLLLILALAVTPAFSAVQTTTVEGYVLNPSGGAHTGTIVCTLSHAGASDDLTTGESERVASKYSTTIASSGAVNFALVPNDAITPANTSYTCVFTVGSGATRSSWTERWSVGTSPDPVDIGDITRLDLADGLPVTLDALTCTDCVTLGTETIGNYAGSPSEGGGALSLQGADAATGVPVDADGDAVNEARIRAGKIYGETVNRTVPCWDLGGGAEDSPDGTCDVFFDSYRGAVRGDGTPLFMGPVSIFANYGDFHPLGVGSKYFDRLDWELTQCKAYGMPCGVNVQTASHYNPPIRLPDANIKEIYDAGVSVGSHTDSHCAMTLLNQSFSPNYAVLENSGGRYTNGCGTSSPTCVHTGTVSVTEGSANLVGTATNFAGECNDNTDDFAPPGGRIFIDTDGDGTVEFNVRECYGTQTACNKDADCGGPKCVADFSSDILTVTDATHLVLRDALPTDTDRDGTTGETFATAIFEIVSGPGQWRQDLKTSCAVMENAIGDPGYKCRWFGAPGGWIGSEIYETAYAASDIDAGVGSGSGWDNQEFEVAGAPTTATVLERFHINCGASADSIKAFMETAAKSRLNLFFSGHTPIAIDDDECRGPDHVLGNYDDASDAWSQANFPAYLQKCRELMRDGRGICLDPYHAGVLMRAWSGNQLGVNLIGNSDLADFNSGWNVGSGNVTKRFPWEDPKGTININDAPGSTDQLDYDATNQWAVFKYENADGDGVADDVSISQRVKLSSGYYQIGMWYKLLQDITGANNVAGVRLCIGSTWWAFGGKQGVSDLTPQWVEHYKGADNSATGTTYFNQKGCTNFQVGNAGTEDQIIGYFYVPPEQDGIVQDIYVEFRDCDGDGTSNDCGNDPYIAFRDVTLVKYVPQPTDSRYGGMGVTPLLSVTKVPHNSARTDSGAWTWLWTPNDQNSGQSANPTTDFVTARTIYPAVGPYTVFAIGKYNINSDDTWRGNASPMMRLGNTTIGGATGTAAGYGLGQTIYKGSNFSGAWVGRSTTSKGVDWLLNLPATSGATEPAIRYKALNYTKVDTDAIASWGVGGSHKAGDNTQDEVAQLWGAGTLSLEGGLKLGTDAEEAVATGTNSLCIKRKTDCGASECVFIDLDCNGTVDAPDFCMHSDGIDTDCDGDVP
ncbi:MAG TPA: hypothetical protein PKK95_02605 [Vicinamibacterales bacterium]|nr:hypothetical protein [Vicinamibacterales bacterium]